MRKFDLFIDILKTYDIDVDDYAVYGSAPLVINGMVKDVNDLDVIIRPSKWPFENKGEFRTVPIEFFDNWDGEDIDDLIDNHSFKYNGINFITPKKVLEYKKKLKRLKDRDIWGN